MIRPTQDNVVIALKPLPKMAGSIHLPDHKSGRRETREAVVLAVGPGHHRRVNLREARETHGLADAQYVFVPTQVKPGETVLVDAIAGQDYALDLNVPRHNLGSQFEELLGERGEFRIVREDEIHCVVEP